MALAVHSEVDSTLLLTYKVSIIKFTDFLMFQKDLDTHDTIY